MGKRVVKILDVPSSGGTAVLLIISASFLLGGVSGCVLADLVGGNGSDVLGSYLEGYLSAVCSGGAAQPGLFTVLWEIVRWPLLVFVLGITPFGLLGIPILFLVRGFLLSFAIASFFRALGSVGLILAFVVLGLSGLLCLPVLFVLGVQSFLAAAALTGRLLGESKRRPLLERATLARCGFCAAALCVCGFIEYSVVPVLLESLAGALLG